MDKVLVFDVWGDYAHFRKFYTTSSPLTFSIPPRTSVTGLLAAIIGLGKDEYLKHFSKKDASIGIRLLNPVKKTRIGINLINTKGNCWTLIKKSGHEPRTQIRTEFLKYPKFRIYISHTDQWLYESLRDNLSRHKSVYTPCLGLSELLCNFSYVGEFGILEKMETEAEIGSVVPLSGLIKKKDSIKFEPGKKYFKEKIPMEMTTDRVVTEYGEVMYEAEGKSFVVIPQRFWEIENGERIMFL
ncbi:MAG: type I-B CRISPR-associated protein Cas5b [Deltaproteobacteria bacterium]